MTEAHGSFNSSLVWFFTFVWCSGLGASAFIMVCVFFLNRHWRRVTSTSAEAIHHDRQIYKTGETIITERSFDIFLERLLCDFSCSADLLVHVKRFKNFLGDENNRYLSALVQKRALVLADSLQPLVDFIDERFKMSNDVPILNDIQLCLRPALVGSMFSRETRYRSGDKRKLSRLIRVIKSRNRAYRAAAKDALLAS